VAGELVDKMLRDCMVLVGGSTGLGNGQRRSATQRSRWQKKLLAPTLVCQRLLTEEAARGEERVGEDAGDAWLLKAVASDGLRVLSAVRRARGRARSRWCGREGRKKGELVLAPHELCSRQEPGTTAKWRRPLSECRARSLRRVVQKRALTGGPA
jgi:hypothetical protein